MTTDAETLAVATLLFIVLLIPVWRIIARKFYDLTTGFKPKRKDK